MTKPCMKEGFTLVEMLIVIAIIGILSGIILTALSGGKSRARDGVRLHNLTQIRDALELYYGSANSYPSTGYDPTNLLGTWQNLRIDDHCNGTFLHNFGKTASDIPVIPGIVPADISVFPVEPTGTQNLCYAFFYISNGADYKYLAAYSMENAVPATSVFVDPKYPLDHNPPNVIVSIYSKGAQMWDFTSFTLP